MPQYSDQSKQKLETCDWRLRIIFNKIIEFYDVSILEGIRPEERQNKLFNDNRSKVKFPNSKHNPDPESDIPVSEQKSNAIDVAPYPINFGDGLEGEDYWKEIARFYYMAGLVFSLAHQYGIDIRWGGDWDSDKDFRDQTFDDLVHFELVNI